MNNLDINIKNLFIHLLNNCFDKIKYCDSNAITYSIKDKEYIIRYCNIDHIKNEEICLRDKYFEFPDIYKLYNPKETKSNGFTIIISHIGQKYKVSMYSRLELAEYETKFEEVLKEYEQYVLDLPLREFNINSDN